MLKITNFYVSQQLSFYASFSPFYAIENIQVKECRILKSLGYERFAKNQEMISVLFFVHFFIRPHIIVFLRILSLLLGK